MKKIPNNRTFSALPEDELKLVHSPFYPVEVRRSERYRAIIVSHKFNSEIKLDVWRLSPLGVELLCDESETELISKLNTGDLIDLNLYLNNEICIFNGIAIRSKHTESRKNLLGIRWCQDASTGSITYISERRDSRRWLCSDEFLPTGISPNPSRFNDFIHFRVRDISTSGLQLYASLRNKHLVPGMELDTIVSFPLVGQVSLRLKIKNARIITLNGRDYLSLGTSFVNSPKPVLNTISQYVFQFGPNTSVKELKKEGLPVKSISSALEYTWVKTSQDYKDVLQLRKEAYIGVNKLSPNAKNEDIADIFDARSRILMVKYRSSLIASLRIIFHEPEDRLEHEEFIKLPKNFPRKDQMIEVTRICTHPSYRGADLLYSLIKQVSLIAIQSDRKWIVGSATKELTSLYVKMGYRSYSKLKFKHKNLGSSDHFILLGNMPNILSGQGMSPHFWNYLYSDLVDFAVKKGMLNFSPVMNIRMNLYKMLLPISRFLFRHAKKPRRQKQ